MAAWLDLAVEATGWTLADTGRLESLVDSMGHPKSQYPSLVYFVGNSSRAKALRALFPYNNITRKGPASFIKLHLSTETANYKHPVLFAESSFLGDSTLAEKGFCQWPTEKLQHYPIQSNLSSTKDIKQHILSNFVLPWTHTLCFLLNKAGDIMKVRQLLERPRRNVKVGTQIIPNFLQVIIVLEKRLDGHDEALKELILWSGEQMTLNITLLDLRERHMLSPKAAFEPLRRLLLSHLSLAQSKRFENGLLFSAKHLCAFWNHSLQLGIGMFENSALDCLAIARECLQLHLISPLHISNFLTEADNCDYENEDISAFIASAFLMNAYPPDMHLFNPEHVFRQLYEERLANAWKTTSKLLPVSYNQSILTYFTDLCDSVGPKNSPATIRRSILLKNFKLYGGLYSTTSCFFCLCKYPEHMMPCHHAICDTCAVIFGKPSKFAEYEFDIENCPLCDQQFELTIRQLPPTKGPVILTLDGGGIRGIIQLGLLRCLEKKIGCGILLPQVIDLFTGTSVGALNAMDFVFNKSSAEDSFQKFPEFARQIFVTSSPTAVISLLKQNSWVRYLIGFLSDGQYDEENLENILKSALGSDHRLFDFKTTSCTSSRVAVITSRISDGKACVLANYRGVGMRSTKSAYQFLIPQALDQNPFLWEAARCSVAAPWFFKTKSLPGFGSLQDGGVRANNPLSIALKESVVIWPEAERHDLLVSVGTGSTDNVNLVSEDNPCGKGLRDSALPRLIRAAMASPSMDGEQGYFEALNYVPDHMRADIYRLDHKIPDALPRLDDVSKLMKLAESDFDVPDTLVRAILVTGFFFFELDERPVLRQGMYYCNGSILCRSQQSKTVIDRVRTEFPGGQFRIAGGDRLGIIDEDDGCSECGFYRKTVTFTVTSLEEFFTIEAFNSSFQQKIGGFPKSARQFLADQQALNCFGRTDHSVASWPPRRSCFCIHETRRLVQFLEPPLCNKRRRIG